MYKEGYCTLLARKRHCDNFISNFISSYCLNYNQSTSFLNKYPIFYQKAVTKYLFQLCASIIASWYNLSKMTNVLNTWEYIPGILSKISVVSPAPNLFLTVNVQLPRNGFSSSWRWTVKVRWGGLPRRLQFTSLLAFSPRVTGVKWHPVTAVVWALIYNVTWSLTAVLVNFWGMSVNCGGPE